MFILDEPTSGLAPISREEILDIFLKLIENKDRAILFSTHITSDLDKVADDITYIRDGEIILSESKEDLIKTYLTVSFAASNLSKIKADKFIGHKNYQDITKGLILRKDKKYFDFDFVRFDEPTIDDIMYF